VSGWSSADYQTLLLTRYVPIVCILAVHLTHEDMWCATSRELASKHEPEEMTKATLALSLLLSSKLILLTKAGTADTEETAWSALGLDRLCVCNLFSSLPSLPQKYVSQTSFLLLLFPYGNSQRPGWMGHQGVGWGFHKFNCFEKTDVASMDWSYYPFVSTALISGYTNQEWPNGIAVIPTRCCTSRRVYYIAFSMFSPKRISARSCSYRFSMCEIRSQELVDSPPKMCVIGAKKTLSRLYSQVSIQAPLFSWNQVLF